ncbi:MAG TPA: hypothetical protein VFT90_06285 [Chryseosolibacter sp.]|nr:hypothetical protein [Chryseosolibacter sp.]
MEALGAFAVLISLGGFIITAIVVIVFFFMASNISGIAQKMRSASHSQDELKLKLDRIIRLMEHEANQRSNERNA